MVKKNNMDFKIFIKLFLKYSDNLCLILSDDWIVKEISPVTLKILGWKKKDVCKLPIDQVFKKYSTQPFINISKPIENTTISTYVLNKNHKLKINWNIIPIYNNDKKVDFIFIVGKFVTELTDKQVEYLHLANLVKYAPGFFYWKDINSVYLGCNDEFANLAGLESEAEVVGKTDFDLIWKAGAQEYVDIDKEIIKTGKAILNHEEQINVSHNKMITALTNKVPLLDKKNRVIGILGITTDITEQKNTEKALSLARIAAESANALKTNFVQNMQHDIRTPASSLWAVLNNLVSNHQLPDGELLILLRDSAKQLMDICNDVIDFDRIEHGEISILSKRFNIRQILTNVIELNKIAAFDRGLNLSLTIDEKIPQVVKGDEHRLSRILINLMGNALKFTTKGSITLRANLVEEVEQKYIIQFILQDTGIGILPEKKNTLYEKFNRINPANRNTYKGSGLGLRIVKKYVDDLDGEINVQSELNKGTIFFIDIPFEKALVETVYDLEMPLTVNQNSDTKKTDAIIDYSPSSKSKKHATLLIEDNALARKIGETTLRSLNCNVTTAIDVSSAIEALKHNKFDLVVSDIGLPDGTGIDVINAVKRDIHALNFTTPFVALSANADLDTVEQSKAAGFFCVMAKPIRSDKLQAILDESYSEENKSEKTVIIKSPFTPLKLKLPQLKVQLFELSQIPLFELTIGLNAVAGKKEALENQLKQLITRISDQELAIQQAAATHNWSTLGNLACKIKANSTYCGTLRLDYACYYVEQYCNEETNSSLLEKLCEQLLRVMHETREYLIDWLEQKNRFSTPSLGTSFIGGLGRDLPETEEQLFELEQYSLLDVPKGIEILGNEETLSEILLGMIDIIPEHKAELQQAYAAGEWDGIEKLAHKVKSGAEYPGTLRMKYACMYLERYRKAGYSASLEKLYLQLMKVLDDTQESITDWLIKKKMK